MKLSLLQKLKACPFREALLLFVLLAIGACTESTLPDIRVRYPDKRDLHLTLGPLSYNLEPFLSSYKNAHNGAMPEDWWELADCHGIVPYNSFTSLNYILPNESLNIPSDPERRAKVTFDFTAPFCKNYIRIEYPTNSQKDRDLVESGIVRDAPKITGEYLCDFSAHTITTSKNHISIKWEKSYEVRNNDSIWIELEGDVDPGDAFVKSSTGDDEVAVRDDGNGRVVVVNTIPASILGGVYSCRISSKKPVISDVLSQPVYKGGQFTKYKWDQPLLAKLNSK